MNYNNLITGLRVQTQIPLDYKGYVQNEAALVDLGNSDNLAYTYYKGLIFYCKNEGTRYEWKEVITGEENTGLRANDFIYPPNFIVDGVNYSNKRYNFYTTIPPVVVSPLDDVLVAGNSTTHSILFGDGGPIYSNIGAYQVLIGNGPDYYTLTSSSLSHNNGLDYSRLKLPINTGSQATFETPLKASGTYTLATTSDNYWTKTGNNILNNNTGTVLLRGGTGLLGDVALRSQYLNGATWMDSPFRVDNNGNLYCSYIYPVGHIEVASGNGIFVSGNSNNYIKGYTGYFSSDVKFKYESDLSATYDDRTLIDKGYLDNKLVSVPLEFLDEGNGNGIVIKGRNSANYGPVGSQAVDLSVSSYASVLNGAIGIFSFASGRNNSSSGHTSTAMGTDNNSSGQYSFTVGMMNNSTADGAVTMGYNNQASQANAVALGRACVASGQQAVAMGYSSYARSYGEVSVGLHGTDYTAIGVIGWDIADRGFNVGIGPNGATKKDGFTVFKSGLATLPQATNALIAAGSAKSIVTKEYLEAEITSIAPSLVVDLHYINSWVLDEQYTFSTGLAVGKVILSVTAFLECTTSTQGYVAGDIIPVPSPERDDAGGIVSQGVGVQFSSSSNSDVRVITASEISIMPAYTGVSTGSPIVLSTPSAWKLRIVIMSI